MIEEIRSMIYGLCENYDKDHMLVWKRHMDSVIKYSVLLAKEYDADIEIVETAATLHDICKLKNIEVKTHHICGAREAGIILKKYGYPKDKIERVQQSILTHSSDMEYIPESIEAKCVANADSIAHFKNYGDMKMVSYIHSKNIAESQEINIEEAAKEWLIWKYKKSYNKLTLPKARELVKEDYEKIKRELGV